MVISIIVLEDYIKILKKNAIKILIKYYLEQLIVHKIKKQ